MSPNKLVLSDSELPFDEMKDPEGAGAVLGLAVSHSVLGPLTRSGPRSTPPVLKLQ